MSKISTYGTVIPAKADIILGSDKSNTTNDAGGETANFLVEEFSLSRTTEKIVTGATYTLLVADRDSIITMNVAAVNTVTIPANATQALPIGTSININQEGVGITTIKAASGVTLRGVSQGQCQITARYGIATVFKRATNDWIIFGAVGDVA